MNTEDHGDKGKTKKSQLNKSREELKTEFVTFASLNTMELSVPIKIQTLFSPGGFKKNPSA